jgi:hypothetical protein
MEQAFVPDDDAVPGELVNGCVPYLELFAERHDRDIPRIGLQEPRLRRSALCRSDHHGGSSCYFVTIANRAQAQVPGLNEIGNILDGWQIVFNAAGQDDVMCANYRPIKLNDEGAVGLPRLQHDASDKLDPQVLKLQLHPTQ